MNARTWRGATVREQWRGAAERPRSVIQRLLGRASAWWHRFWAADAAVGGEAVPHAARAGWTLIGLR